MGGTLRVFRKVNAMTEGLNNLTAVCSFAYCRSAGCGARCETLGEYGLSWAEVGKKGESWNRIWVFCFLPSRVDPISSHLISSYRDLS
jgi:hypothetical protein